MSNQPITQASIRDRVNTFFGISFEIISLMFLVRLIVDTSNRIFIPFIPQVASGLGLTITAFGWLLALRSLTGLASPIIGVLADRYGRRLIMGVALAIRGIGLLGLGFTLGWWSAIPMLLISLSTTAYLPVQKAYVSDQVCYKHVIGHSLPLMHLTPLLGSLVSPLSGGYSKFGVGRCLFIFSLP